MGLVEKPTNFRVHPHIAISGGHCSPRCFGEPPELSLDPTATDPGRCGGIDVARHVQITSSSVHQTLPRKSFPKHKKTKTTCDVLLFFFGGGGNNSPKSPVTLLLDDLILTYMF